MNSMAGLKEIVDYSKKNRIGIGLFNIVNLEFAQAIFDASQETGLPVMFGIPEVFYPFYDLDVMVGACKKFIEKARAPIAIHLDHGLTFDGVITALRAGFTSVMFDGSSLDYEENVAKTAEIVKIAHAAGVTVEGELGYVGKTHEAVNSDNFTKPEQAVDFVRRTGVDALAVAIGNQHGQYKGVPKLDFERLKEIREKLDCGLVLHGGSGIAPNDFVEAIRCGINKINIYTVMDLAVKEFNKKSFGEFPQYLDYTKGITKTVKEVVKEHMLLFARAKSS